MQHFSPFLACLVSFAGQLHRLLASLHQQQKTTQPGCGKLMEQRCRALSIQVGLWDLGVSAIASFCKLPSFHIPLLFATQADQMCKLL